MGQIKLARLLPIHSELVLMVPGGNMRMAACLNVRINANRNRARLAAAGNVAFRLLEQHIEFGFRLDVEKQNTFFGGAPRAILHGAANFFAGFADARENNAIAGNSDVLQLGEFAAGNYIESASLPG